MRGQSSPESQSAALQTTQRDMLFDVSEAAIAERVQRLGILVSSDAAPGVAVQLQALAVHAEQIGLSVRVEDQG